MDSSFPAPFQRLPPPPPDDPHHDWFHLLLPDADADADPYLFPPSPSPLPPDSSPLDFPSFLDSPHFFDPSGCSLLPDSVGHCHGSPAPGIPDLSCPQFAFLESDHGHASPTCPDLVVGDNAGSQSDLSSENLDATCKEEGNSDFLCSNSYSGDDGSNKLHHMHHGTPSSMLDPHMDSTPSRPSDSDEAVKSTGSLKVGSKRKCMERKTRDVTPEATSSDASETQVKEDDRRQVRLMRNRESAQLSRQRKKCYISDLEEKVKTMASTIAELNNTINLISAENINLRKQLGFYGGPVCPPGVMPGVSPWMNSYPHGPLVTGSLMMPGSQVPLVPIPRWRSQQSATEKKVKKSTSETKEANKAPKRTKKVAGIAFVGIFFFVMMLLPSNITVPRLHPIDHGDPMTWTGGSLMVDPVNTRVRGGGRVLTAISEGYYPNETQVNSSDDSGFKNDAKGWQHHTKDVKKKSESMPLTASLFVPRNNRLEKIEGNLIIHSVLAGNQAAMESFNVIENRKQVPFEESMPGANLKAISMKNASESKGALVDLQKALSKRSKDGLQRGTEHSIHEDNVPFQQWFMDDLAGSAFSSGQCTEVLQFEASTPVTGSTSGVGSHSCERKECMENKTKDIEESHPRKGRSNLLSRKNVPYVVPLPPAGHKQTLNYTSNNGKSCARGDCEKGVGFGKQNSAHSSVVVSLLAGSDSGDPAKFTGSKGLSRIFIVVLIDSVKYVTYSCMLPSTGSNHITR